MKRTLILLAVTLLILSACAPGRAPTSAPTAAALLPTNTPAPTATPTHIPSPTATPTAIPTVTPTPIPTLPPEQLGGLSGVPDPHYSNPELFDLNDPDAPIPQFVNAMRMAGIEVEPAQVVQGLGFEGVTGVDGQQYVVASYTIEDEDGYSIAFVAQMGIGRQWRWKLATTRVLSEIMGKLWGSSVSAGDEGWNTAAYNTAVSQHFNAIKPVEFSPAVLRDWPDLYKERTRFCRTNHMVLYPGALFVHHDLPALPDELKGEYIARDQLEDYMSQRIEFILSNIKKCGSGMVDVVSEAMWWASGRAGWENSPYYKVFGPDVIAEAFIMTYNKALEVGLMPGKDLILLYTDYGIEIDNPKSRFVREQLQRTKQAISQRLGIPIEEVPLAVGIEFHVYGGSNHEPWQVLVTDLNSAKIQENVYKFAEIGDVYFVELQVNDLDDQEKVQEYLAMIIETAMEDPHVKGVILYEPLRRNDLFYGAINPGIFDVTSLRFTPTAFYYRLVRIFLDAIQ